jgi:hypothetical protein
MSENDKLIDEDIVQAKKKRTMRDKYLQDVETFSVSTNSNISEVGMNHNRKCTDLLCLIAFLGTIVAMCVISIHSFRGD